MTEVMQAPTAGGRFGTNDQCVFAYSVEGQMGKNRNFPGSVAFNPDTQMQTTSHDQTAKNIMAAASYFGLKLVRMGSGDKWATENAQGLWEKDPVAFYKLLDPFADWARSYNIQIVFTCIGMADDAYYESRTKLFDTDSEEFDKAARFVGDMAKHFYGHTGVYCIEAFNESDHDHYAFNYWLKNFPDYDKRLAAYCDWLTKFMNLVMHYAGDSRAKLGNGHALIGAMFNAKTYHYDQALKKWVVDVWDFVRNGKDFLTAPNAMCEVPSIHDYWFGADFADVIEDFLKPFSDWCKSVGKVGFVGEHGDLRTGAAYYVAGLEDVIKGLGLDSCSMRMANRANYPLPSDFVYPEPPMPSPVGSDVESTPNTSEDPGLPTADSEAVLTDKMAATFSNGQNVRLREGTYKIKGTLTVPSGRKLVGEGSNTVLTTDSGAELVIEDRGQVVLVNLVGITLKLPNSYPNSLDISNAKATDGRILLNAIFGRA